MELPNSNYLARRSRRSGYRANRSRTSPSTPRSSPPGPTWCWDPARPAPTLALSYMKDGGNDAVAPPPGSRPADGSIQTTPSQPRDLGPTTIAPGSGGPGVARPRRWTAPLRPARETGERRLNLRRDRRGPFEHGRLLGRVHGFAVKAPTGPTCGRQLQTTIRTRPPSPHEIAEIWR